MGTLIAKIKNENQWAKICDQIEIGALDQLDLSDSMVEPTLKSKACLKCLYFTKIISALCCYLEYFSYLYTIN